MISICIINHNTCDHLRACLSSIDENGRFEVVVVDTASTDGSVSMVLEYYPWVTMDASSENPGYGAAANRGIALCHSEYVLLLNSDTRLRPGPVQALAQYLEQHPKVGIVGPKLLNPDGSLQHSCYEFPTPLHVFLLESTLDRLVRSFPIVHNHYLHTWSHNRDRDVPWVLGAALAIRKSAFEQVGGFDPSFFLYAEETDLSYRLRAKGWETHFTPRSTIVHYGGASTSQRRVALAGQYFDSLMHFYRRHYSYRQQKQLKFLMKRIVQMRVLREGIRLHLPIQNGRKAGTVENLETWRTMLKHIQAGEAIQE